MTMHRFTIRDISEVSDASVRWRSIVKTSPIAGLWHTWAWHVYILAAGKTFKATDRSFFIYDGEALVGLCPLILQSRMVDGREWIEAAHHTGLLPWPLSDTAEAEDFAFTELERRAREAGAGHIAMQLYSTAPRTDENTRVLRVALAHHYITSQNRVQVVEVHGSHERARERFRRYNKKFSPLFDFDVLQGEAVSVKIEEEYFRLHVLDAGGQFRPRESYERQADTARANEAFYVRARYKKNGETAGMLLVSFYKGTAFDNSVAINPAYAEQYVGHILRFRGLEELERLGVDRFEMPLHPDPPSFVRIPSDKERNISHFKEGFSRGVSRAIWKIEKFLNAEYLCRYLAERERSLKEFFLLH